MRYQVVFLHQAELDLRAKLFIFILFAIHALI